GASRAEQPVTCITKARQYVAFVVELLVNGGGEDRQARIMFAYAADTFGRRNEANQADVSGTEVGKKVHCGDRTAAGGQHRVDEDDLILFEIRWEAFMVEHRPQCGLFPTEADKPDPRVGNQLENGIQHAETGSQNRDKHHITLEPEP